MPNENSRVLTINPGSTSTKCGVYTEAGVEWVYTIQHKDEELIRFRGRPFVEGLEYRVELIASALAEAGYEPKSFAAVAGRGGFLPPTSCGTYLVDEAMLEELRLAKRGDHPCNLGAMLAAQFAQQAGANAYIVDPVTVDEWQDLARVTGCPQVERVLVGHALNTKAMARRFARERGCSYESLRLIMVHMGSGVTVSAHVNGRGIDSNSIQEGPFGPDRTGSLPSMELVNLCFSGRYTHDEVKRMIFGAGGLFAYLGTRELIEVERRIANGDREAERICDAMIYQIAKEAGAMAVVLNGKVDGIVLTGGMANSARLVAQLRSYLEWIGPITVYPGEDELQALAEGVFRVLNGEEQAKRLEDERATC